MVKDLLHVLIPIKSLKIGSKILHLIKFLTHFKIAQIVKFIKDFTTIIIYFILCKIIFLITKLGKHPHCHSAVVTQSFETFEKYMQSWSKTYCFFMS